MFSFLERFLGNKSGSSTSPSASISATRPAAVTNAYHLLNPTDQEVVRAYFFAATDVCRLLDSLRLHEQAAHEAVLTRFEQAEKKYSGLGFLPILPGSTRSPGRQYYRERPLFEPDLLPERGFLVRRQSGKLPFFYASALKRQVATLRAAKPRQFVSSPRVALLKTATVPQQPSDYQAWTPEG